MRVRVGRVEADALVDSGSVKSFTRPRSAEAAALKIETLKAQQSCVCADERSLTAQRVATEVRVDTGSWAGSQDFQAEITQELL